MSSVAFSLKLNKVEQEDEFCMHFTIILNTIIYLSDITIYNVPVNRYMVTALFNHPDTISHDSTLSSQAGRSFSTFSLFLLILDIPVCLKLKHVKVLKMKSDTMSHCLD